jgi:hypothetical protein
MQRLVNVADKVLQPDKIVGFDVGGGIGSQRRAKRRDLRLRVRRDGLSQWRPVR